MACSQASDWSSWE